MNYIPNVFDKFGYTFPSHKNDSVTISCFCGKPIILQCINFTVIIPILQHMEIELKCKKGWNLRTNKLCFYVFLPTGFLVNKL